MMARSRSFNWSIGGSMVCFLGRILIGAKLAPESGLQIIRGVFENPLSRRLAKALRSRSFLISISVRVVLGSGFLVSDSGAQNFRRGLE